VTRPRNERGIAILTVITALVALMIIAVPFGIAMRMGYERSVASNARVKAQTQVDSALDFLEAYLGRTTDNVEEENRAADRRDCNNNDPDCDTLAEIQPTLEQMATELGVPVEQLRDPYGTILGFSVEDENGKINLNDASYFAIANIMGNSPLSAEIEPGNRTITVEDASAFPERGYLKIGRELVMYRAKEGNQFTGCERGMLASKPEHGAATQHKAGEPVVNFAAWAVAYYKILKHPGEFTRFQTLDVSDISSLYELDPEVPVLTQADWERVAPFFTVNSRGPVAESWTNPQLVVEGTALPRTSDQADNFNFASSYYFNRGTLIRLQERWQKTEKGVDASEQKTYPPRKDYAMVYDARPTSAQRGGESTMEFFGRVHRKFDGTQLRVESLVTTPVNVNTAPREVLIALFANLQPLGQTNDRVTPVEAAQVADAIIKRRNSATPLRSLEEFSNLLLDLKSQGLTMDHTQLIFRNAVNPHDNGLEFGTAPITFRTFDVYTLHAGARVADKGGRLLAQLGATSVVEIGSQLTVPKTWDTQVDFETALSRTNSARYWTSGPSNAGWFIRNVEPWPRWQKPIHKKIYPFDPYARETTRGARPYPVVNGEATQTATNGDIRLEPARMEHDTAIVDPVFVEHFDTQEYVEGLQVDSGYTLPAELMHGFVENDLVQAFSLQFWFQPRGATGNAVLFDWGESEFTNRVACFVDASQNQLVFRVADGTQEQRASDIRYDLSELNLMPDNWYHIHFLAAGCNPSMMTLLVDGRVVGKPGLLTHLAGGLSADGGSISVRDAGGFPDTGALLIGNEVIEYQSVSDGQFVVRSDSQGTIVGRGVRGTLATDHPDGATCVLFGYSRPICEEFKTGGATLTDDVGPWSIIQVDTQTDMTDQPMWQNYRPTIRTVDPQTITTADGGSVQLSIFTEPITDTLDGFTVTTYGNSVFQNDSDKKTIEQQRRAFQNEGFALVVYLAGTKDDWDSFANGGRQSCKAVAEFMHYTDDGSGGANGVTLQRLANNGGAQSPPELEESWEILLGYTQTDSSTNPPSVVRMSAPIIIIPISLSMSQAGDGDYINPVNEDNKDYWVAQLLSDSSGGDLTKWEWVRYSEIFNYNSKSFLIQGRVPNERLLVDTVFDPDYDNRYLDAMLQASSSGGSAPGGDPGGTPGGGPGGGGSGGADPGHPAPGDPPQAPPSDGSGSDGGSDPGPHAGGGGDDGPGSDGSADPGPSVQPPGDDGPGTDSGSGSGSQEPPSEDGGGSDGSSDPGDHPTPPGDDSGGGDSTPPDSGGGSTPPTPPSDSTPPSQAPDSPAVQDDGVFHINASVEGVASLIRFRGVQSDRDHDGHVDDWWGESLDGNDALLQGGTLVLPVGGLYGGPQPTDARSGHVTSGDSTGATFTEWPMPGHYDRVTLVLGDGTSRESDNLDPFFAMTSLDERLEDPSTFGGSGTVEPWQLDQFTHLVAFNRKLERDYPPTSDAKFQKSDYRRYNRLLALPSGEMPDNISAMGKPTIAKGIDGGSFSCVIDEIVPGSRNTRFPLSLAAVFRSGDDTMILISREGRPDEADLPKSPGVVRVGDEIVAYREAEIQSDGIHLTGCRGGLMRTTARSYDVGTPAEVLDFGIYVAILTEGIDDNTNVISAVGADRFPTQGVIRIEHPDLDKAELLLYHYNDGTSFKMPISDIGGGLFRGRYGTDAMSADSGTPVFWQPVRTWDRFAEFSDDPQISYFYLSAQLTDAFIKRIYWDEGTIPERVNVRVLARLNEEASWNASADHILYLSTDGSTTPQGKDTRYLKNESPLKFLRLMETPNADNLINLQAEKVECRIFVIYEQGAYQWNEPAALGWKFTPKINAFHIEYMTQNRVRRHIDR
jgi:hypothetical protein